MFIQTAVCSSFLLTTNAYPSFYKSSILVLPYNISFCFNNAPEWDRDLDYRRSGILTCFCHPKSGECCLKLFKHPTTFVFTNQRDHLSCERQVRFFNTAILVSKLHCICVIFRAINTNTIDHCGYL